jgi:hypothetical protein
MKDELDEREMSVVYECLKAAAYGPFFVDENADDPYWEIHALFGLSITELREIADSCPNIDMVNENVKLAINNSFNNLLGYPHGCDQLTWSKYISVPPEEVARIFKKWRGEYIENYFDGMR